MAQNWLAVAQDLRLRACDGADKHPRDSRDHLLLMALYHHLDAFICDHLVDASFPATGRRNRRMCRHYEAQVRAVDALQWISTR